LLQTAGAFAACERNQILLSRFDLAISLNRGLENMHEHSLDVRRNPFAVRKLLPSEIDLQKYLSATNTAACVHTRIATYLGGYERSSFS
jgi:hypothetical protein